MKSNGSERVGLLVGRGLFSPNAVARLLVKGTRSNGRWTASVGVLSRSPGSEDLPAPTRVIRGLPLLRTLRWATKPREHRTCPTDDGGRVGSWPASAGEPPRLGRQPG